MRQQTAKTSTAVTVTTSMYLLITAGCVVLGLWHPIALLVAVLLALIAVGCYLTAPVAYELSGDRLTVFTHIGSKDFAPITKCEPITTSIWWGLRLFGNGGVFAGTGYFWSVRYGVYRAYITSAQRADMLMIETPGQKVLITPEDTQAFRAACGA